MKGEILFEKMTGISEEYITEAALVPAVEASTAPRREGRFAALSRALNGGWGVACICVLWAIAAVVSILYWGLPKEPANPFPPTVDPNAPRYIFTMDSLHSFSYGESVDRPVELGEKIRLSLTIRNNGPAFQHQYSDWAEIRPLCVLQSDDSVVLEWCFSPRDDLNPSYWVQAGATEALSYYMTVPEDAVPGVYDLVLSYKGVEQIFSGALTVGYPTGETKPPIDTPIHAFSFGYEPFGGFATVNAYVTMETWIVNEGAPFTFTGSSMGFAPGAVLVHADTGYRIEGMFDVTTDFTEVTVYTGEEGRCTQEFFIPADAPTGDYDLVLTYETASQTFENVLTVAIPSDGDTPSLDLDAMWEIAEQYIPRVAENVDRIYYTRGSYSADYTLFSFRVTILGMQTTESLYVTLGSRGEYRSHEQDPQTFSLFIPYITAEMIEAAKPPLYEHPDYPVKLKHQYGLTLRDGDLYLAYACYDDSEVEGEGMTECYYSTSVFLYADPQRVEAPADLSKLTMAVGAEWLYEPLEEA